jgi:hypothetical protein
MSKILQNLTFLSQGPPAAGDPFVSVYHQQQHFGYRDEFPSRVSVPKTSQSSPSAAGATLERRPTQTPGTYSSTRHLWDRRTELSA